MRLVFTTPIFYQKVHVCQLFLDFLRSGIWLIYLVDGEYHGHTSHLSMVDGFFSLRHDAIVRCNYYDGNVRDFGTTGTHGGKGFVTGSIQEGNFMTCFGHYIVSTNVLGDTSCFSSSHFGHPDVVKQGGLSVIHVAHDGHDRGSFFQFLFRIFGLLYHFIFDRFGEFNIISKFISNDGNGFRIQSLVDRNKHP